MASGDLYPSAVGLNLGNCRCHLAQSINTGQLVTFASFLFQLRISSEDLYIVILDFYIFTKKKKKKNLRILSFLKYHLNLSRKDRGTAG